MQKKLWWSAIISPLVIAPVVIVASCSSDNTTTTSQNAQDEVKRLNDLITTSKFKIKDGTTFDQAQIDELKKTPDKLLTDYLDKTELKLDENKFTYNVETDGFSVTPPTDNTKDGTINFKIKVTNKTTTTETATTNAATVTYKPSNQAGPTNPLLDEAVKKIQDAHSAQTFKLKDAKKTMAEADVNKLKDNPSLLLTDEYTDGFPSGLGDGLTTSINKTNFSIVDKKQAQGTAKTIQFKVTVSDAQKVEKDTQQLTFDFTLQAAAQPTPAKQPTVAKASVTAGNLGLTGKLAAEQSKLNSNFIFQNITKLVDGDHAVTKAADVTDVVVTPDQNDSKQLTLAFKLAANTYYVAGGTLGQAKSENFSIPITGFAKAVKAAAKKAEFNASDLGQDFASKTYAELNTAINSRAWLFTNKEKYLNGDLTTGTTQQNFVHSAGQASITFVQSTTENNKATLTFSIAAGRTYDDEGIVSTTPTQITFVVLIGQ